MYVTPEDQPKKKFELTPASAKDFELAPVTAEAFMPENLGGIEPVDFGAPEPGQGDARGKAGFVENAAKKFSSVWYKLGKGITELPQMQEGTQNVYVQALAKAYINKQVKKGRVDAQEAEYYKNNMSEWIPKMGFIYSVQPGEQTLGEKIAESGVNAWLGKTADQLQGEATRYDKSVTGYLKSGEYGKAFGAELTAVIESAPYMIAAAFGGPMGAAGLGAVVGAEKYDEIKDREDMTEAMKIIDSTSTGVWEAVFEYFGTKQAVDYLRRRYATVAKDKVEDEIKNGIVGFLSKAYKKFGVWFASVHEGTSEFATQVAQNLTARWTGEDPERSMWDGAIDSFLVGWGMGTGSVLTEQGMEQIPKYYQRKIQGQNAPADPDAEIKASINAYGEKLKFNSNVPLAEDQNPLISIASHKIEDKKFFLTGESGAIGDHVFTAYDFDALQEAGYDLTQVRPQLIKASDIRERMDIPYQEWLQQEVNQFKQTQVQGQQMVVKAQAPVQEGQEITLGDKNFNVTFVDETGITLNEIDKQGNITGGELIVPPEDYEKVFGVPAAQSGQISPLNGQVSPEDITEQGQVIPEQVTNTGQPAGNIPEQVQLPVNKKGEIEYDQITEPDMYAQGLTEEFGEDAPAILDELIAEQTEALAKAKKGSNAIERARKVKAINAELKKLSGVKEILTPTAIAEGPSLEAPSASPVVELPEPIEQATEQELARPEEEEQQPVVEQTTAQTPSTPDETAPVEAEMQEAGEVEQPEEPATEKSPEVELTKANAQVDTKPTEAQKEAGNYQKGHIKLYGLDISIENPVGSIRKGTDKKGNDWAIMLNNSYGYIRRTVSPEGNDQVDVFLGDNLDSDSVYIIDQIDPDSGKFDEHKVMMGFTSAQDAKDNYLANYEPGWKGLGDITKMSVENFKKWVFDKEATQKPLAYKQETPETKKEPWQMTREEYGEEYWNNLSDNEKFKWNDPSLTKEEVQKMNDDVVAPHIRAIKQALSQGKQVPDEVIADYPELKNSTVDGAEKIVAGFNEDVRKLWNIGKAKGFVILPAENLVYKPEGRSGYCETNTYNKVKSDPERYFPVGGYMIQHESTLVEHWWVYDKVEGRHIEVTPMGSDRGDWLTGYFGIISYDVNDEIVNSENFYDGPQFLKGGHVYHTYLKEDKNPPKIEPSTPHETPKAQPDEQRGDQETGQEADNTASQAEEDTTTGSDQAGKEGTGGETEFAGASLENTPRTRSLREFNKGDHVKNIKTGNEYEVVSVPKTGDVSLKKLGEKQIKNFNGKLAQWIPIQREIKAKRAKRTVKFKPDSKTGKLLSKAPQSFKELILQFFIGGGRVSHSDFFTHVGWKASKTEGYIWAVKGAAVDPENKTEQGKAFDSFWEDTPEEWGRRGGTEDTNEIADILITYPSITQMMDELRRLQSVDESVPDRNMPSPEELGAAVSDADIEDDLANHEDEVVGRLDDVWDNPDYQIIFDKYSTDKGLDVDKLLVDINNNPEGISNLTPFGLNNKELTTLKNYLEDEQSRRKESQVPENIQGPDKDKSPDREEDSPGSDQGDRVRGTAEEVGTGEGSEVVPPGREYKYKMNARPFDIGTYPKEGFVKAEDDPRGGFQILTYDRKLTEKERNHWSFLPLTEVDDLEGKQFEDQDGEYFVDLEWMPNYSGADVSMFDSKNQLVEKPYFMSTNDILKNIESGYWVEKKEAEKSKETPKDDIDRLNDLFDGEKPANITIKSPEEGHTDAQDEATAQKELSRGFKVWKTFFREKGTEKWRKAYILSAPFLTQANALQSAKFQLLADASGMPIGKENEVIANYEFKAEEVTKTEQKSPYSPIQQKQIDKINKEYSEQIAKKEAAIVQAEKDMREALLKADERNGLFGDTNPVEKDEIIKRDEQGFSYSEATRAAVRKPFEEKMAELRKEIAELTLEQKGKIESVIKQQDLFADTPVEPAESKPIDKESLPKHEDFGQKIGGARKDMEITRKVRDTDSLPAWRRKYHYANADGTLNIGAPIDTSKPFIVQWAKDIDSWGGKRTVYRPVTTIDTRETKVFNSEEEAEAYIPIYEVWKQNFRVRKVGDNYAITKTSSTNKVVEYATFPTEEEANTYMYSTEGATSLLNHKREDFSIPALDKVERTGKDWRKGKDISTEEFMETFGFRGGEFGNWVKPEERRVMLNAAYDSFMDLAELLGVPPRSLSLSGELSIAFGARGVKGAAAHFEPDRAVINLTRMNGAGSLAHEWAHALDNYFGLQAAKKDYSRNDKGEVIAGKVMRTTADLLSVRGMRKELSEIFDKIIEATQEKSVTRKMGIEEKQKYFDKFQKSVQREADDLIKKFTNGVRRYQYNRKTKQREDVVIKATPEQIKKVKAIADKILEGKGTKPVWERIPGSKGMVGKYSYISPETLALEELHKEVFGKTGLDRDGNGFYNLGYYGDRMYRAKETLDKALAGESETLNVPTDFLKTSKEFDKSRANPYWATKIEMFARAFEYFIESKLLDQNVRADYLQYDKAPVYDAVYGKNPYPQGEERAELNRLFQEFFKEVKVKTDENNVSLLYEKAEEYISENKVYSQARPQQDFPEGVSYLSERASGALSGQLDLFGTSNYTPTTDDGNVTYVERLISERGVTFLGEKLTGPPTIRTSADIAYLFKNLESATSENAFAVLISETGEYKVLYLGTGATTGVIIDSKLIVAAAKEFGAKRVVVVHNHPSGNLKPSGADMAFDRNIMSALESMDIDLDPSIIIDLDSGEFTVFAGENVDYKKYRKEDYGTDVPVEDKTIYQFEKKKLYVPASERTTVKNSADIAEYLSKMKRGTTPKLHVMILDRSLHINRYLLYDETISNEELIAGLLYEVGKHGEMVALASNTRMSPGLLVDLAAKLKKVDSDIIDFIQIKQRDDIINNYMSYGDEGLISEPKVSYVSEFAGEYLEGVEYKAQDITKTPAFKKWFGDSKVVDENGKPLVVYHGSPNTFDTFNLDKVGAQGSTEGHGFYFTADREIAQGYAERRDQGEGKLYEVYLKIENPYSNEKRTITKTDVRKILSLLHKKDPEYALSNYGDIAYEGLNKVLNIAVESENEAETDTDLIGSLVNGGIAPLESVLKAVYDITGKDGVITSWENGTPVFVTASPTQIKSATGNRGTFDSENPNILEEPQDNYRFAGDWLEQQPDILSNADQRYNTPIEKRTLKEKLDELRRGLKDVHLPIRRFEEAIKKLGGVLDDRSKPYRDINLAFERLDYLYNQFMKNKFNPINKAVAAIRKSGIPAGEVLPYIIAKRATELNPKMRQKEIDEWITSRNERDEAKRKAFIKANPKISAERMTKYELKLLEDMEEDKSKFIDSVKDKDYSGVMPFDYDKNGQPRGNYTNPEELAKDIVAEFEKKAGNDLTDNLWKSIREATGEILNIWERGSQLSPEDKAEYEKSQYYVPLRGWRFGAAKSLVYTRGEGFSKSLKHAEGRSSLADNPLAYIEKIAFTAIQEQVGNEVNNSMANLIIKNLNIPGLFNMAVLRKVYYVKQPDGTTMYTIDRPSEDLFANKLAEAKTYTEHENLRPKSAALEHEVTIVRRPAGDLAIIFKDDYLQVAQALNKQNYMLQLLSDKVIDTRTKGKMLSLMSKATNILKANLTQWNVVFPFTNHLRDSQEGPVTQYIKHGKPGLKTLGKYPSAYGALFRYIFTKPDLSKQMDRDVVDFYENGGATGYTHGRTVEDIEKQIEKDVSGMIHRGVIGKTLVDPVKTLLSGISFWNQFFEDASRLAVYRAAISMGMSKKDAAYESKEATINMNRKGLLSKQFDAWTAFFNVALEGTNKNISLAKHYPRRFAIVATGYMMLGYLNNLLWSMLGDDDDDLQYKNISPYMRQNYLTIPNPVAFFTGNKSNRYVSIPLAQFWRAFFAAGNISYDVMAGRMKAGEAFLYAGADMVNAVSPIDVGGFWVKGKFSIAPLVPTITRPVVEIYQNRDFLGNTIYKKPFTRALENYYADAGLGKKNANPAAKMLTDFLYATVGRGDKETYLEYRTNKKGDDKKIIELLDWNPSKIEHIFKGYLGGTGAFVSDLITTVGQGIGEEDIDFKNIPFINKFVRTIPEAKWAVIDQYYSNSDVFKRNEFSEGSAEKIADTTGDYENLSKIQTNEYRMEFQAIMSYYSKQITDTYKDYDFDYEAGNKMAVDLMTMANEEVSALQAKYGKK